MMWNDARPFELDRLQGKVEDIAPNLLGAVLCHRLQDGAVSAGRVVEVEAYSQDEPSCHAFRGKTPRNAALFGQAGTAYVYRSYGLHWCVNVVCGPKGYGAAILLRALEPLAGIESMMARRNLTGKGDPAALRRLCAGPGNLTQALGLDRRYDGASLLEPDGPLQLLAPTPEIETRWRAGPRIGISKAQELPWRFFIADSPYVSHRRREAAAQSARAMTPAAPRK